MRVYWEERGHLQRTRQNSISPAGEIETPILPKSLAVETEREVNEQRLWRTG